MTPEAWRNHTSQARRTHVHGKVQPANDNAPWLIEAWRAADWFDRCIALALPVITAVPIVYMCWGD